MTPRNLTDAEQSTLIKELNKYFPHAKHEALDHKAAEVVWEHAIPLLSLIIRDRQLAKKLLTNYPNSLEKNLHNENVLSELCQRFVEKNILQNNHIANPYLYRLHKVSGELEVHRGPINQAIDIFNTIIEDYHKNSQGLNYKIDAAKLNQCFLEIVKQINLHGKYCFRQSLHQLIIMLHGYSCIDLSQPSLESKNSFESSTDIQNTLTRSSIHTPISSTNSNIDSTTSSPSLDSRKSTEVKINTPQNIHNKKSSSSDKQHAHPKIASAQAKNIVGSQTPFIEESVYTINKAGRLASQRSKLVINGFGLKFGGHADALLTHTPTLIQVSDFYSILWRELGQHIELPSQESNQGVKLKIVLLTTLQALGLVTETIANSYDPDEFYLSPFSVLPMCFLTPNFIKKAFNESIAQHKLTLNDKECKRIQEYLQHVIFRMQFNISEALGIGANDDDTVSFSNTGRDYIFQFDDNEETCNKATWAEHFARLSLHRQGPAQAYMNAAIGAKHELTAVFLTESLKMTQLQRSEYKETVYNALIDNAASDLFPHPNDIENEYEKYKKEYIFTKNDKQRTEVFCYSEKSDTGIFKENDDTTPKFRRAGTIDIHALPKDHPGISASLMSFNSQNPLAAKQFQDAQARQMGTRGHYVYNPIGPDGFIPDMFKGQVVKNNDASHTPFIGIIPKNLDKFKQKKQTIHKFKQKKQTIHKPELCGSFVGRTLQSSRLATHCPTFLINYERLKTAFLPSKDNLPDLPTSLKQYEFLQKIFESLKNSLDRHDDDLSFTASEKIFKSLFIPCVLLLHKIADEDEIFLKVHYKLVTDRSFFKECNRSHFDKIINVLKINAPLKNAEVTKEYLIIINYLEHLTKAFYPEASEETAKKIQKLAKEYTEPLTAHKDLQNYFAILRKNPLANISRTQSPGMLFMLLKEHTATENQTLRQKHQYLNRMHKQNFAAGYRNAEGDSTTKPDCVDEYLDGVIKGIGKISITMQNNNNPLGQAIAAPFTGAYHAVVDSYAESKSLASCAYAAPLGFIGGIGEGGLKLVTYGTKFIARPGVRAMDCYSYYTSQHDMSLRKNKAIAYGLFIPLVFGGFIGGLLESTGKLLYDCTLSPIYDIRQQYKNSTQTNATMPLIKDHPLYIEATPSNEPGFKVKTSNTVRDTILETKTKSVLLEKLKTHANDIIKKAHPDFTQQERHIIITQLISDDLLTDAEWTQLLEGFDRNNPFMEILNKYLDRVNNQLISAVFHCFVTASDRVTQAMIDKMYTAYKLLHEQKEVLIACVNYFNDHPDQQENLIWLASHEGVIKDKMKQRDHSLQVLHDATVRVFDSEILKNTWYNIVKKQYLIDSTITLTSDKIPSRILAELRRSDLLQVKKDKLQALVDRANKTVIELNKALIKPILNSKPKRSSESEVTPKLQNATVLTNSQTMLSELKTNPELEEKNTLIKKQVEKLNYGIEIFNDQIKEINFKLHIQSKIQDESKVNLPALCNSPLNNELLSAKDKAHLKWNLFAVREIKHEFLSPYDCDEIFKYLTNVASFEYSEVIKPAISNFIDHTNFLTKPYKTHDDKTTPAIAQTDSAIASYASKVDAFYIAYHFLKKTIETSVAKHSYPANLLRILNDFVNVTMNTVTNQLLDIINENTKSNPLNESAAIGNWLKMVYQSKESFQSLLAQQFDQTYLHKSILRQAYIIHALETTLKLTPSEHIHYTSLRKLLYIHYLDRFQIKKNGAQHYKMRSIDDFEKYLKSHGIELSPTFHYIDTQVKTNLGFFRKEAMPLSKSESLTEFKMAVT